MNAICPRAPPDFGDVIKAAEVLSISEYDFFHLAFRRWSGHEPEDEALERAFVNYMFHQAVPTWVRHFSRDVLARETADDLNFAELGALEYRQRLPPARHGGLYIGLMGAMMVLYSVALMGVTYDPETSAPMPCSGGPGFKIISEIAHAVSGKEPPSCKNLKIPH